MPWLIVKQGSQYCVHKENPDGTAGEQLTCHPTDAAAQAHLRALYAAEPGAVQKSVVLPVKQLDDYRVGGYAALWGNEEARDLDGEWFTPDTEEMTAVFSVTKQLPYFYDHARDDTLKAQVIGVVDTLEERDIGLWYEAQLRRSNRYAETLMQLVAANRLGTSSGTLPAARRVAKSGRILRWPMIEISGTPTPSDPRQVVTLPVRAIKSAYTELDMAFDLEAYLAQEADLQTEAAHAAQVARVGVLRRDLLDLELNWLEGATRR